jgi:hypothetical protein
MFAGLQLLLLNFNGEAVEGDGFVIEITILECSWKVGGSRLPKWWNGWEERGSMPSRARGSHRILFEQD